MADSHFLKKYIFIDFFPFSYKAVKKKTLLLALDVKMADTHEMACGIVYSLHTTEQYHCLVPFL